MLRNLANLNARKAHLKDLLKRAETHALTEVETAEALYLDITTEDPTLRGKPDGHNYLSDDDFTDYLCLALPPDRRSPYDDEDAFRAMADRITDLYVSMAGEDYDL